MDGVRGIRNHLQSVRSEPDARRLVGGCRCRRQHRHDCDRAGQRRWRFDPTAGWAHRAGRAETPERPCPCGRRTRDGMPRARCSGSADSLGARCRLLPRHRCHRSIGHHLSTYALIEPPSRLSIAVATIRRPAPKSDCPTLAAAAPSPTQHTCTRRSARLGTEGTYGHASLWTRPSDS